MSPFLNGLKGLLGFLLEHIQTFKNPRKDGYSPDVPPCTIFNCEFSFFYYLFYFLFVMIVMISPPPICTFIKDHWATDMHCDFLLCFFMNFIQFKCNI